MDFFGIILFILALLLFLFFNGPIFLGLIALSAVGTSAALLSGTISLSLLGTFSPRIMALLENDTLQIIALFAMGGAIISELSISKNLFEFFQNLLFRFKRGDAISYLLLGGVFGPLNGSVAATLGTITSSTDPKNNKVMEGYNVAAIAVASTLGIVIPPSLILFLLSDALFYAHSQVLQQTGRFEQVISSGNIFRGALIPVLLIGFMMIAIQMAMGVKVKSRTAEHRLPDQNLRPTAYLISILTILAVIILFTSIYSGWVRPVEGVALAVLVLMIIGFVSRSLTASKWLSIFENSMTTTGSIFALIIGATSFTLGLRFLGTDRLLSHFLLVLPFSDSLSVITNLFLLLIFSIFLDIIEVIFVIIPIMAPPLFLKSHDPQWIAVLIILILQLGFISPPFGYSFALTRSTVAKKVPISRISAQMIPYFLSIFSIITVIYLFPQFSHIIDVKKELPVKTQNMNDQINVAPLEEPLAPMISPLR